MLPELNPSNVALGFHIRAIGESDSPFLTSPSRVQTMIGSILSARDESAVLVRFEYHWHRDATDESR
ncbi:hypothetical protein M426DRAFT_134642 [Hypoxylon sp. CI-4A]|nr:hypothetical protein M426DRAFT_134642 [Hypoxylon sp. CI-4A]